MSIQWWLGAAHVSSSHSQMHMLHQYVGFHYPLPTTVTSWDLFFSFKTHTDSLGINCPWVHSTKTELYNPFAFFLIHKKTTFCRNPRQVDHGNAILHYNNSCYLLSSFCLPGLGQLLYSSSYLVLSPQSFKGKQCYCVVQRKKWELKQPWLGGDRSK